ncbi:MAG: transcription termination/antitermination protein NusG [Kiloniellaceae bacterium]
MTGDGEIRWYAVQTKPGQENKAAFNLRRQGYGVYLPKYARLRRHARKTERVARPLFSGYLFVGLEFRHQGWHAINSTLGVARLVAAADAPVAVPEAVIEGLRAREGEDCCIRLEPQRQLKNGDKVRITEGAFESFLGLYQGLSAGERALVLIDFLGRKVRALIDPETLAAT